jgi:hypothetical protein
MQQDKESHYPEQLTPGCPSITGTYFAVIKSYVIDEMEKCILHYNKSKGTLRAVGHAFNIEVRESDVVGYISYHATAGSKAAHNSFLPRQSKEGNKEAEWDSERMIGRVKERFKELEEKEWDWRSFYNGWLEGRSDMLQQIKGWGEYKPEQKENNAVAIMQWAFTNIRAWDKGSNQIYLYNNQTFPITELYNEYLKQNNG